MKNSLVLVTPLVLFMSAASSTPLPREPAASDAVSRVWTPGDVWAIVLTDRDGNMTRSLVIRITERPAKACRGGHWKELEVLADSPASRPAYRAQPAYQISNGRLDLDLSINVCDAYRPLVGRLTPVGFEGAHGTLSLDGFRPVGKFYGVRVGPRSGAV